MKRSYAYFLSAVGICTAIFGGMAVAQQKAAAPADKAAPTAVAATTEITTPDAAATPAAPAFDIKSVASLPVGAERGQKIAAGLCASCHQADGNSTVSLQPKLAGQHEAYLYKQLREFKPAEGATEALRANAIMAGQVAPLSDDDMKSLAIWFSAQKLTPSTAQIDDEKLSELGKKIYKGGIMAKGVPACAGCHGPTGAGIAAKYPRVSGQFSAYMEAQLKHFRDDTLEGGRRNSQPMQDIAKRLTDTEIQAVADYMAGVR